MLGICGLAPDINKCPHYIRDKEGCGADHTSCGFFRQPEKERKITTHKGPKWFEQYYDR